MRLRPIARPPSYTLSLVKGVRYEHDHFRFSDLFRSFHLGVEGRSILLLKRHESIHHGNLRSPFVAVLARVLEENSQK
jgi:hypothetical protein